MLIQDDDGTYFGRAWNDNGLTGDFESDGEHAQAFNQIRSAWGENNCITYFTDNTVTFTDAEGGSVLLSFDNEKKTFVPIVSEIENGTPNMFKRTINVNDNDVTFVCDADGKVCWFNNNGNFLLLINDDEITPTVDGALMNSLVAATGGSTEITNEQSADDDYNKYTNGDYSFVTDANGSITFGEVTEWVNPYPLNKVTIGVGQGGSPVAALATNGDVLLTFLDNNVKKVLANTQSPYNYYELLNYSEILPVSIQHEMAVEHTVENDVWYFTVQGTTCSWNTQTKAVSPLNA